MASLDELLQQLGFGGVTRNRAGQIVGNTNDVIPVATAGLADTLYGAGRGTLAGTASIAGFPGDINQMYVNNLGALYPNAPAAPTSEQVSKAVRGVIPKLNLSKSNTGDVTSSLGEYVVSPMVSPGSVVKAGRALAPNAAEMAYKYIGPGSKLDPAMYVYRPTSPSNPDPLVGTQFKREYMGGLIDKTINDLSNKQGASLLYMPWDNSSRNMKITQVSGEDIPPVLTHGGQDYILDIEHRKKGIGGASGLAISKKIQTRDAIARQENLAAGGTGEVISTPLTMARFSENYSVQPTQVMLGLIGRNPESPRIIPFLNEKIRTQPKIVGSGEKKRVTYPYAKFAGVETELGQLQLLDISSFAGDLRKVFLNKAYGKSKAKGEINFQKEFGFNAEDIEGAIGDAALAGLPRGYGGNAFISSGKKGIILQPSDNATYNTDLTNMDYLGGMGFSAPVETFMGPQYLRLAKEQEGKSGDLRSATIGAIEKRKAGVSTMIDDAMLRRLEDYKKGLLY
jgi:hypothetical protein